MNLWWLSFCDASRPTGAQFLGACVVRAPDMIAAVRTAHALGINPGGEVQGVEIPAELAVPEAWVGRLMTRDECGELDLELGGA